MCRILAVFKNIGKYKNKNLGCTDCFTTAALKESLSPIQPQLYRMCGIVFAHYRAKIFNIAAFKVISIDEQVHKFFSHESLFQVPTFFH